VDILDFEMKQSSFFATLALILPRRTQHDTALHSIQNVQRQKEKLEIGARVEMLV
jgi:hypothetical protein